MFWLYKISCSLHLCFKSDIIFPDISLKLSRGSDVHSIFPFTIIFQVELMREPIFYSFALNHFGFLNSNRFHVFWDWLNVCISQSYITRYWGSLSAAPLIFWTGTYKSAAWGCSWGRNGAGHLARFNQLNFILGFVELWQKVSGLKHLVYSFASQ